MLVFVRTLQDGTYIHVNDHLMFQFIHNFVSGIAFGNACVVHAWLADTSFQRGLEEPPSRNGKRLILLRDRVGYPTATSLQDA